MQIQQLSSILLIAGFAVMLASFAIGLGNSMYRTTDLSERERIIEENETRWNISQLFSGLGVIVIPSGFTVLASRLRTEGNAWIPTLSAAGLIFGAISGAYFVYRQTTDPVGAFSGSYPGFEPLYNVLSLAGLLLLGFAFLQAGLPAWLGYLTAGVPLLYGVVYILTGSGFLTPGVSTLLGLVIGIFLLWQKPLP